MMVGIVTQKDGMRFGAKEINPPTNLASLARLQCRVPILAAVRAVAIG